MHMAWPSLLSWIPPRPTQLQGADGVADLLGDEMLKLWWHGICLSKASSVKDNLLACYHDGFRLTLGEVDWTVVCPIGTTVAAMRVLWSWCLSRVFRLLYCSVESPLVLQLRCRSPCNNQHCSHLVAWNCAIQADSSILFALYPHFT